MEEDLKNVISHWMEGEISTFLNILLMAISSLSYCYFAGKTFTRGTARLAAVLPVVCLFLLLPLQLHTIVFGMTATFCLSWLATFKVLAFAFDHGPLSTIHSLPPFVAVAMLPIELRPQDPPKKSQQNAKVFSQEWPSPLMDYVIKALWTALIIKTYDLKDQIHPFLGFMMYWTLIYFSVDIALAITAGVAGSFLRVELERPFNKPHLATSLQDFWGSRWNVVVTRILRTTVFLPMLRWSGKVVGRRWAPVPAVMATFVVSGLMHGLIFYDVCRMKPAWGITWFFVLHGACLVAEAEIANKAVHVGWQLPRIFVTILTVGFVMGTGSWLLYPPIGVCRVEERGLAEAAAVGAFVKDVIRALQ